MSEMFDNLMNKPPDETKEEPVQEPQLITDEEVASATPLDTVDEPAVLGAGSYSFDVPEKPEPEGLAAVYAEGDDVDKQKAKCLEEIDKILKKHDGMESNISLKHEYWDLTALYRRLTANP